MAKKWTRFPHADPAYLYEGAALKKAWPRLHQGDREPYPKDAATADAWRHFHAGAFRDAVDAGRAAGDAAINAAVKAQMHLRPLPGARRQAAPGAVRAGRAVGGRPAQRGAEGRQCPLSLCAGAGALRAGHLGREGARTGLRGEDPRCADRALELEPKHAEAVLAYGAYQSEVIDKVGGFVAGLTYGAKKDGALGCFERAMKLFPESPIVHVEYANGLIRLFGKSRLPDATRLYEAAAKAAPCDAMERLDVEFAKTELE